MNFKVLRQIPYEDISSVFLDSIRDDLREFVFALVIDSRVLEKGHICRFNNNYTPRVMSHVLKYEDGWGYYFCPPNHEKFDSNKHLFEDKTFNVKWTIK